MGLDGGSGVGRGGGARSVVNFCNVKVTTTKFCGFSLTLFDCSRDLMIPWQQHFDSLSFLTLFDFSLLITNLMLIAVRFKFCTIFSYSLIWQSLNKLGRFSEIWEISRNPRLQIQDGGCEEQMTLHSRHVASSVHFPNLKGNSLGHTVHLNYKFK